MKLMTPYRRRERSMRPSSLVSPTTYDHSGARFSTVVVQGDRELGMIRWPGGADLDPTFSTPA